MYYLYLIPFFVLLIIIFISYNPKVLERKMTMVILSNDKTICAEYNRLTVQRNYGNGKDNYPTKEDAVAELEKIYAAYQNGDKTYAI